MESRPGTVIVPLDGSKAAEQALPLARSLADALDAKLDIIHVVDDLRAAVSDEEMEARRQPFLDYVRDLAAARDFPEGSWCARVELGFAAPTILERAAGADAIVIASHGRGGAYATFIGSVADKVVRGAPVPVVVVPAVGRWTTTPENILVPLDGSEEGERALTLARTLGKRLDAKVILVEAYNIMPPAAVELGYYPPDLREEMEKAANDYLAGVATGDEQRVAAAGDASAVIAQVAAEVDAGLVVMSSSGKGLAARLVLGSTTDRVLHSLHRPLMIVPKKDANSGD